MKTLKLMFIGIATLGLLASCGGSGDTAASDSTVVTPAEDFNGADVMFAQMMIPHHEQAIEMSDLALDPTTSAGDTVKELATQIKNAQDPEIQQMTGFLTAWKKSLTMDGSMDHSDMMSGMLTLEELETLATLRGDAFDRAWITGMIAHHEGAIEMANDVLADGKNSAVRELATAIIAAQDAEIAEMKLLLG